MSNSLSKISIVYPDDWHVHLRDGELLNSVLPFTTAQFARAIVMPNLTPPITSTSSAISYRERILKLLPEGKEFIPLMTCYLTDNSDPNDIELGFKEGVFVAVKLYPANATTNSDYGVSEWKNIFNVLSKMEKIGMPLLVHGEDGDPSIDIFDREAVFIEKVLLGWMIPNFPGLKIVLEHTTTANGVDFVKESGENIAATITPHHLVINRNDILAGGIRPHLYCLPIAKREKDKIALREAAISGDPSFFLGTDSAPHLTDAKENNCGCAGIFNSPNAMGVYASVFEELNALDKLEGFASLHGPSFYGMPFNKMKLSLFKRSKKIVSNIPTQSSARGIRPFLAGETIGWSIEDE